MNLPPPPAPQDDDPIITQFKPVQDQWELTEDNIKRIDPKTGKTILHNYCQHMDSTPIEVYRYLIEVKGCNVHAQNKYNDTPLHNALHYFKGGNFTTLMYLLTQKTVNVNIKNNSGHTLLHDACERINTLPLDVFKVLIETMGCGLNMQNNNKDTPLHLALRRFNLNDGGNITTLTYLLTQKNVNVNIKGEYGYTILHTACQRINKLPLDVFKLLIETHGANVNAQNNFKINSLHDSINSFNPNEGGDIAVLMYLLTQKGVNIHIKGDSGYTLLHYACEKINILPLAIFKLLIETSGADVNAQDKYNDTPLHLAFGRFNPNEGGNITVLMYLLSRKSINFDIKGQYDRNLLHWASVCGTAPDSDDDFTDLDDDFTDSDDDLSDLNDFDDSNNSVEAKGDTLFHPVIEVIVETCLEQILDETRF